jgi:hypothetical protein
VDAILDELGPIAGVSLAAFVAVSIELARVQFDASRASEIAADLGIPPACWGEAADGWSRRLRTSPTVAGEFARLYQRGSAPR